MKISYNWLKQYVNCEYPAEKVGELLTSTGLEVEDLERFESVKGALRGVVVGKVLTCIDHPNSDHLHITTVDVGGEDSSDLLDNFIKNSLDWEAKNFWVTCSNSMGRLVVDIYDDGLGLSNKFLSNPEEIFDFSTSGKNDGTGFGMYLIRETLKDFKATIEVSEPVEHKGIHFKVSFK